VVGPVRACRRAGVLTVAHRARVGGARFTAGWRPAPRGFCDPDGPACGRYRPGADAASTVWPRDRYAEHAGSGASRGRSRHAVGNPRGIRSGRPRRRGTAWYWFRCDRPRRILWPAVDARTRARRTRFGFRPWQRTPPRVRGERNDRVAGQRSDCGAGQRDNPGVGQRRDGDVREGHDRDTRGQRPSKARDEGRRGSRGPYGTGSADHADRHQRCRTRQVSRATGPSWGSDHHCRDHDSWSVWHLAGPHSHRRRRPWQSLLARLANRDPAAGPRAGDASACRRGYGVRRDTGGCSRSVCS
jgi:hypothetical protein